MVNPPSGVLVIASVEDAEQAHAFIEALRRRDYRTEQQQGTENANEFAACVVLLRPQTLLDPVVVNALNARPQRLILLLLEPTQVPPVVWGAPVIVAQPNDDMNASQTIAILESYAMISPPQAFLPASQPFYPPTSQPFYPPTSQPLYPVPSLPYAAPTKPPTQAAVNSFSFPIAALIAATIMIVVVAICGVAIIVPRLHFTTHVGGVSTATLTATATNVPTMVPTLEPTVPATPTFTPAPTLTPAPTSTPKPSFTPAPTFVPTSSPTQAYATNMPGAACDSGDATWQQSPNVMITCGTDSTLMSENSQYDRFGLITFRPPFNGIPASYQISVQATFVSYTSQTTTMIQVHGQAPAGGDIFQVSANGHWIIYRLATNNNDTTNLASGTVSLSGTTATLKVVVQGGIMQCFINGLKIGTITDSTFSTSTYIALGLSNLGDSSNPISMSLTQFSYTPSS